MQICSSMVINEAYVPVWDLDKINSEEHDQNDDQLYVGSRSPHVIIRSIPFVNLLKNLNYDRDYPVAKRESFGRKHHWDAFFG